jgi:hypothetical protein
MGADKQMGADKKRQRYEVGRLRVRLGLVVRKPAMNFKIADKQK